MSRFLIVSFLVKGVGRGKFVQTLEEVLRICDSTDGRVLGIGFVSEERFQYQIIFKERDQALQATEMFKETFSLSFQGC